ncbi:MAG: 30S ribosomal protein S17 [Proteobacteria bacterium]|jgi:small subunit ribosomal protein S17|nr:30S ribosomal protein S17 [Desulfobacterales bacterium]MBL6967483.1 30S ribosomal protein S17 [Desulfobacteraceae bacterium]MBU0735996.1 30S ribosomal protein S17 [Pseudomonadota bacterium]MBU0990634.1 30S ribosomal protein S17 [Pseudomonadota bacterium]MBU1904765.1 30S ribosomal protein S17 [Pseudomonadota bacterium]
MGERGQRKRLVGTVIGNRMNKTAVVLVERLTKHATYNKYVRRRAKYMAHDAGNICGIGDKVRIIECRPLSKRKRWQIADIIEKSQAI